MTMTKHPFIKSVSSSNHRTTEIPAYLVDQSETTGNWNVYTADKSGIAAGPFYTKSEAENGKRELEAGRRMLNHR